MQPFHGAAHNRAAGFIRIHSHRSKWNHSLLFLWKWNSNNVQLTILKLQFSGVFCIYEVVQASPLSSFKTFPSCQQNTPRPVSEQSPRILPHPHPQPHPSPLATIILLSVSMDLPIADISYGFSGHDINCKDENWCNIPAWLCWVSFLSVTGSTCPVLGWLHQWPLQI